MASFDTFEVEGSGPESVAGSTGVPKLHKLVLPGFSRKEEKLPLDELMDVPEEKLPKREENIPPDEPLDVFVEEDDGAPSKVLFIGAAPKTDNEEIDWGEERWARAEHPN